MDSATPAQLKPCPNPWCHRSEGLPPALTWTGAEAYVECTSCGLQGPWVSAVIHDEDGEFVGTRNAEAEAIAAWNQRPAQDSTQEAESELVARLRGHANANPQTPWRGKTELEAADRITRLEAALGEAREALEKARHRLLKEGFTPNDPTVRATISALTALGGGGQ